jgi:hypothetical protein
MGLFKLGVVSVMALAIPAGAAFVPKTAMGQTDSTDTATAATNTSGPISTYGTSDAPASDSLLALLGNPDIVASPQPASLVTADDNPIVDDSAAGLTLSEIPVLPQGDPVVNPAIPEPAAGSIALVAGLALLVRRRRKPLA